MRLKIIIMFIFGILFLEGNLIQARENFLGFDERLNYDIYFENGEGEFSVIDDVKIKGFQTILDKTFLVVEGQGFKLNDEEGFVLFDSITAILPNRNFVVHKGEEVKFRHNAR